MSCPNEDRLISYFHRRISVEAATELECHLDQCAECRRLIADLARFAGDFQQPAASEAPDQHAHSKALGDFLLHERVAQGGMGQIWRATDRMTKALVAIKRLVSQGNYRLDDISRRRLIAEARAIAQLSHQNIVRYLGFGFDDDDQPYLAMEWLEGEDLAKRQRSKPVELQLALAIIKQALSGLAACHLQGIIHRDLKPSNLFLTEVGEELQVKLIDFGLALISDRSTRITQAGEIMGTLSYLSPEQAQGADKVDHRSDLYSLGVVLYGLVTGNLPFQSNNAVALLLKIVTETPPRPRQLRPELPDGIDRVIWRAMQRDPGERFSSAQEMLAAVTAVDLDQEISILPDASVSTRRTTPEHRLVSLLCAQPTAAIADFAQRIAEVCQHLGGTFYQLLGGPMVSVFGLNKTTGQEAQAAVQAGLAVLKQIGDEVKLLVATVHLEIGEGSRLALRDLDQAIAVLADVPQGFVMLDSATQDLVTERVTINREGAYCWAVAHRTQPPTRRRILGGDIPLVGRGAECAAIRASFSLAKTNAEMEVMLITGPPGIGKSRLCQEVLGELRGQAVLCLEVQISSAPDRDLFQLLAGALAHHAEIPAAANDTSRFCSLDHYLGRFVDDSNRGEVSAFVGEIIGVPLTGASSLADHGILAGSLKLARSEPKLMREKMAWALQSVLAGAGELGPVIIIMEDLHLVEPEDLLLLERLLPWLENHPLFLLATARPELLSRQPDLFRDADATRLALQPLGRRPMRRLLRAILGQTSSDQEELISKWSAGNPYFAEELVCWLVMRKALVPGEQGWQMINDPSTLPLPVGIESAIQGRIDELELKHKELLKGAAVLGEVFSEQGCQALGFYDVDSKLQTLAASEFISPCSDSRRDAASTWTFRHALLQQVAYRLMPTEKRQALHVLAAKWLGEKKEQPAALIAYHYEQGGDHPRAAARYAQAGGKAISDGNLSLAVEYYRRSIEERVEDLLPGQQAERLLGLARSLIHLGRYDECARELEAMEPLLELIPSEYLRAEMLLMKGRILLGTTSYAAAEEVLHSAAELLAGTASLALAFEARRTLFWVLWVQGRYQQAQALSQELELEADKTKLDHHLCSAKLAAAYVNVVTGDLSRSLILGNEAVRHAKKIGHLYLRVDALILLATVQELVGHYGPALSTLSEAQQLADRLQVAHHQANIAVAMGRIGNVRGEFAQASQHFQTATRIADKIGDDRTMATTLANKARAMCGSHELVAALELAQQAVELAANRAPPLEAEARLSLAEVNLALQRNDIAAAQALAAVELLDQLGGEEHHEIEILCVAYEALQKAGQMDKARQMLGRAGERLNAQRLRISDVTVQDSFINKVRHNQKVYRLWKDVTPSPARIQS